MSVPLHSRLGDRERLCLRKQKTKNRYLLEPLLLLFLITYIEVDLSYLFPAGFDIKDKERLLEAACRVLS